VPQAGAIAVRLDVAEPLFLLVTARRHPDEWIFPKGHLEPGEAAVDAAVRELKEEAGVEGTPLGAVDEVAFRSGDEDVRVTYFLVRASTPGEAREGRRLAWLPHPAARARLSHANARALLDRVHAQLTTR
jgi:8-oxo-dGTP pyrophosphatase MutT (NUDIX family)